MTHRPIREEPFATIAVGNTHVRAESYPAPGGESHLWRTGEAYLPKFLENSKGRWVIIGGVVPKLKERLAAQVRKFGARVAIFRKDFEAPIKIVPQPAEKVGDDRIAGALGALAYDKTRPWVVVDMGTAMTINAVTPGKGRGLPRFEGGLILPGLAMSLNSLAEGTALLPKMKWKRRKPKKAPGFIGRNTLDAMWLGCLQGQLAAAIQLAKEQRKILGPDTDVMLTGGGSAVSELNHAFLKAFSDNRNFGYSPNLVNLGLYRAWLDSKTPLKS